VSQAVKHADVGRLMWLTS